MENVVLNKQHTIDYDEHNTILIELLLIISKFQIKNK